MNLQHAYLRVEDLNNIRSNGSANLVARGVREDGSLIVAKRSIAGHVISWFRGKLGKSDESARAVVEVFCRQLNALGPEGSRALNSSGVNYHSRVIKLDQARIALNMLNQKGFSPKVSEAAIYSLSTKDKRAFRSSEISHTEVHLAAHPESKKLIQNSVANIQTKYGELSPNQSLQLEKLITWMATERFMELRNQNPGIPLDALRQKALLEAANKAESGSDQGIKVLLSTFGKKPQALPRFARELEGTIPEDQAVNLAWIAHQADIEDDENVASLFHFIIDRNIEKSNPLPEMFSIDDIWTNCFDAHPQNLGDRKWTDALHQELDQWVLNQLPSSLRQDEAKKIAALTQFISCIQLLGMSSKDAIKMISEDLTSLSSDSARYPLKLTNESWSNKPIEQCKKIVANDIKRLHSNPQLVSTLQIHHTDGSAHLIELDNTEKMSDTEKSSFKSASLSGHPVMDQIETQLNALCVSEAQVKAVLSGISANSQVILAPISSSLNPIAQNAGKPGLAGEHSSCEISLKRSGEDVILTLKPIGVDWLDCALEYQIKPDGDGTLTHYHAHPNFS